jgi:hypothetical protein
MNLTALAPVCINRDNPLIIKEWHHLFSECITIICFCGVNGGGYIIEPCRTLGFD